MSQTVLSKYIDVACCGGDCSLVNGKSEYGALEVSLPI